MRIGFTIIIVIVSPLAAMAQLPDTSGSGDFYHQAMTQINPKYVSYVKSTAKTANEKNWTPLQIKNSVTNWAILGGMNGQDIEAIGFLVMMQAAKSAREDLKSIMAGIKEINNKKAATSRALQILQQKGTSAPRLQLDSFKLLLTAKPSKPVGLLGGENVVKSTEIEQLKSSLIKEQILLEEKKKNDLLRSRTVEEKKAELFAMLTSILNSIRESKANIIKNLR